MESNPGAARRAARGSLALLTGVNTLNYIDRYLITAMLPDIQRDLHLGDREAGMLGTAFIVVYLVVSPTFGWLGDRRHRPRWLGLGVALWSLATAAAGLARNTVAMFAARACVGVGEAAYGAIAPALLADLFPKQKRGRMMSYFYLATPVGAALGYALGGALGASCGWRTAFFLVGVPGLALAWITARLQDPPRGRFDDATAADKPATPRQVWRILSGNRLYVGTVAGYVAYTFALGGLAYWMPSYMIRERGLAPGRGMLLFGGITVVTGIVGTLTGGWLSDVLLRRTRKAYSWINTCSMVPAAVGAWLAVHVQDTDAFMMCLVVSQLCTFLSMGPVNALIVSAVPAPVRASAMATSMLAIHMFGDAVSPTLIGSLSDRSGLAGAMSLIPAIFLLAGGIWATTLLPRRGR